MAGTDSNVTILGLAPLAVTLVSMCGLFQKRVCGVIKSSASQ